MFELVAFAAGATFAWALVFIIRKHASGLRLLDIPNERSMHPSPTPRGGGLAIAVVCLEGVAIVSTTAQRLEWAEVDAYLGGASLIAAVSLFDDFRPVAVGWRLSVQLLAALIAIVGISIGRSPVHLIVLAGCLVATVGLTNVYNFMDGIDGLAATTGLIGGVGMALVAMLANQEGLAVLAVLTSSGCAGFLVHNWPPAKVFMGDVGSAFLGFTFAFIELAALRASSSLAFAMSMLLWPFLMDGGTTILRRLWRGENLFRAHRSHNYQRLVLLGWRHDRVTLSYAALTFGMLVLATSWWLNHSLLIRLLLVLLGILLSTIPLVLVTLGQRRADSTGLDVSNAQNSAT